MARTKRRGLVLSGGAALGAYQAGVLMALHQAGLEFEVISSTSIGTINGMAWNIPDVVKDLGRHWLENVSRYRPFDPKRIVRARNPFQFHRTLENIADDYRERYPFDAERAELLVTLADYHTHEIAVHSSQDERFSQADRELFMKASTAILHIGSTPVTIQDRTYYDGGYNDNIPIAPLASRNLDEIWMVPLTPMADGGRKEQPRWLETAGRRLRRPYVKSLINAASQSYNPPDLEASPARKIIISPYLGAHRDVFRPGAALLFSLRNIKRLLAAGHDDGLRALESYR